MQEWLNWLVSKTSEPATVPRVRIPLSPPIHKALPMVGLYVLMQLEIRTTIARGNWPPFSRASGLGNKSKFLLSQRSNPS